MEVSGAFCTVLYENCSDLDANDVRSWGSKHLTINNLSPFKRPTIASLIVSKIRPNSWNQIGVEFEFHYADLFL